MRVLGIDPGGTTGFVRGVVEGREFTVEEWGEEPDQQQMCVRVETCLADQLTDTVVIERWLPIAGIRSFEPSALEIIGTVRYLCAKYGALLVLQNAADAKAFGTPKRLLPHRTPEGGHVGYKGAGHALMALRHVLLWTGTRRLG